MSTRSPFSRETSNTNKWKGNTQVEVEHEFPAKDAHTFPGFPKDERKKPDMKVDHKFPEYPKDKLQEEESDEEFSHFLRATMPKRYPFRRPRAHDDEVKTIIPGVPNDRSVQDRLWHSLRAFARGCLQDVRRRAAFADEILASLPDEIVEDPRLLPEKQDLYLFVDFCRRYLEEFLASVPEDQAHP